MSLVIGTVKLGSWCEHSHRGINFVRGRDDFVKMGVSCLVEFNPLDSSHRGGAWVRMIGISLRVIKCILIEHCEKLDDDTC